MDSLSEDVTDGWKNEEGKKKEESFLKLAMANYQCPMLFGPITNYQFPIPKTNRARTARPIYQQLANNYFLAILRTVFGTILQALQGKDHKKVELNVSQAWS